MAINGFPVPSGAAPRAGLTGGQIDLDQVLDPNTSALLYFYRWAPVDDPAKPATVIPYAFAPAASDFDPQPKSFAGLTNAQQEAVHTTFDLISSYTLLSFRFVGHAADAAIRISQADGSSAAPPDWVTQGDTFFGSNGVVPDSVNGVPKYFGTDGFSTILHELGHAVGLKHGHYEIKNPPSPRQDVALTANVNDNEFSVMTYASWLGSPIDPLNAAPTAPKEGSAPQSYMMYDIAALQSLYGANYGKVGSSDLYRWDGVSGQETINGGAAPDTGLSSTHKIFSTVWTQGATTTYDLHSFGQNQVDDLRPGHFLKFSDGQLANLTNDPNVPDGTPGFTAQGNIYNALVFHGDLRSLIANLITGPGDDTLIGNDRDNHLSGGAGKDTIYTNGGDDIVSGGPDADMIHFGSGHDTLRDPLVDLNGDTVFDFGQGAVDVLGAVLGRANLAWTQHQATLSSGNASVTLNGTFTDGEFVFSQRGPLGGSDTDGHTTMAFVPYLPTLQEGVTVNPQAINGIADQGFLTGDGSSHFIVDFRSAQTSLASQLGWYQVSADGRIHDAHLLVGNTLDPGAVGRSFDLGAPANGERIGFFLISGGATPYGSNLPDDLFFVLPNGQPANVDSWQAPMLRSASLGQLNASPVFHSFAGLNPDWMPQVLSGLQNGRELVIGFEDVRYYGGDRDYQDAVIAVHFTPHDDRVV
jgi:serralysin